MKFLSCATVAVLLLANVLSVPISLDNSLDDAFSVKSVNNTSVCVISRAVYQDGELLPFKDPCEVCRCRPPGIACAYVRCAKKDPKPDCNIVEVKGQCCPQYRCVEDASQEKLPLPEETKAVVAHIPQTEAPSQDQEQESTVIIQSRNEPTEAAAAKDDGESSEAPALEERSQVENATELPKEAPKSIELADESATSHPATEEPREERLDQAATEAAQDEKPASEAPERESKHESATSAPLPEATSGPEKEERKEDAATEQPLITEKQEQGRSDDIVVTQAAVNDEIATGRSDLASEESNSTLEERSDDQEKANATALSHGQESEESTEQQPSERRRRASEEVTVALQNDEQQPTEAADSAEVASEQPEEQARSDDASQEPLPATEASDE